MIKVSNKRNGAEFRRKKQYNFSFPTFKLPLTNSFDDFSIWLLKNRVQFSLNLKVILCAYEHIFLIVRYRYKSFKQLETDHLHVLTDANVLVLVDTDQKLFVNDQMSSCQHPRSLSSGLDYTFKMGTHVLESK